MSAATTRKQAVKPDQSLPAEQTLGQLQEKNRDGRTLPDGTAAGREPYLTGQREPYLTGQPLEGSAVRGSVAARGQRGAPSRHHYGRHRRQVARHHAGSRVPTSLMPQIVLG